MQILKDHVWENRTDHTERIGLPTTLLAVSKADKINAEEKD